MTDANQPPAGISPLVWSFGMSEVRRAVAALAAIAVTRGAVDSNQSGAFVEIGVGVASYAATVLFSWWKSKGQALVEKRLHELRTHVVAIPNVPSNMPRAAEVNAAIETAQIAAVK